MAGGAGYKAAARNGRSSASVCLVLVILVLGMLAGQSTALWSCMGRCLLGCIGFPLSTVLCSSNCYNNCHHPPGDYSNHDLLDDEYYCKLGCAKPPPPPPHSQDHAAGDGAEKKEADSCFKECEKKH